jgi:hypothetical protein
MKFVLKDQKKKAKSLNDIMTHLYIPFSSNIHPLHMSSVPPTQSLSPSSPTFGKWSINGIE